MNRQILHQWMLLAGTVVLSVSSVGVNAQGRNPGQRERYPDVAERHTNGNQYPENRNDRDRRYDRDDRNSKFDRNPVIIVDGNGRYDKVYAYKHKHKSFSNKKRKYYIKQYGYTPAMVIKVSDRYVRRINGGYRYVDPCGFVYWRDGNGFYILEDRYFR